MAWSCGGFEVEKRGEEEAEIKQLAIITMNTQIITQDLGDGYYQHQVNVSTYYYYESIVSPIALRESRVGRNGPPRLTSNLGKFQQYRLSQFVNHQDLKEEGRVVRLASVEKGKLVIDPEAVQIFNKYGENEVAFVGNYGRKDSGKSFWYDKILNLSDFPGNNYSSNRREPGLYFWSIPYTKDNLKFFLVDYAGFQGKEQLSPDEEKLLDFELLLCQKIVVIPEPNDQEMTVLRPAYGHLLQSQRRFSDQGIQANKFSSYWPNQIYTLYRSSKPVKKEIDNIGVLFPVYNFSILHDAANPSQAVSKDDLLKSDLVGNSQALNQKYVKMTSVIFKDVYEKMKGKEYDNVTFKGKNIGPILEQSRERINKGNVKVDQIFDGAKGDIYDGTIQKCRVIYLNEVSSIRKDPEPKPLDVLTDAFERGSSNAFKEFDKEIVDKKKHQEYQKKLQDQIDKIEAEILEENKKKTYEYYNKRLPKNQSPSPKENFDKLKSGFNLQKSSKKLDHDDSLPVEERLESLFDGPEQIHLTGLSKKQIADNLKKQIELGKKELHGVKNGGLRGSRHAQLKPLAQKHEVLITKVSDLKQKIQEKKEAETMTPEQKELFLTILRDNHSKNEEKLNEIRSKVHEQDKINELKDKLKKTVAKNSQIQSGLNSNPDRSLVDKSMADRSYASNRSVKSVIRDIKGENIKKITLK